MELFGLETFNPFNFTNLVFRLLLNLTVTGVIIFVLYYRKTQRRDYMMTFSLISLTVFMLVFLLDNVTLQLGFALGLFAIFGIIRYRTIVIPIKEMTYLFVLIGISIINALANSKIGYIELIFANVLFLFFCWMIESRFIRKHISTKVVMYDNIKLIHAGKETELKKDLEERLGLNIVKIEIGTVDFIKDCAILNVSYVAKSDEPNTAENLTNSEMNRNHK
jgi:hypothetical protein